VMEPRQPGTAGAVGATRAKTHRAQRRGRRRGQERGSMSQLQGTPPSAPAQGPALTIEGISKTFPGQRVLEGIDLTIQAGEVHALLGENGSGKSTLIKVLSGFHPPDPGGRVLVGDTPLPLGSPTDSFRAGLRFVHQKLAVIPQLNAVENIALEAGYARGGFIDWDASERYASELLSRFGIEMDLWRPLAECRPVERSAVAIARALRTDERPVPLVVLDEPTSSLPESEVRQLFRLIRELTASGVAVLYVSHRLDEIFEIADRVSVLRDGRLQGTEAVQGLTRERLVEMIVGRSIASNYEKPRSSTPPGDVSLRVDRLTAGRFADVSLTVRTCEVVGVVGIAGSGREELARALVGAIPAQAGEISVEDRSIGLPAPAQALEAGIMLALSNTQPASAHAAFRIRENLTLASLGRHRRWYGIPSRHERAEVDDWIEALDIRPPDPERPYGLLSGGNQQKVIMGKWLNARPKVLVLDDPTAGVDVGARQAIYDLIAREAGRGLAVVLCSSDYEDVVSVCDRAIVMRNGAVGEHVGHDDLSEHTLLLAATGGETIERTHQREG
jgi:ribose transport system ATP-binding protein